MRIARIVLGLTALVFFVMAVALLARPQLAALVDLAPTTPTARVELAAMYSGLELGVAAFLALCAFFGGARLRPGLLLGGFALGGLGTVRVGVALAVGPVAPLMYWFALAELLGAALCFWAATRVSEASQGGSADLEPTPLGSLPWTEAEAPESLRRVYEHVTGAARDAIGWYLGERGLKKDMARYTRLGAIILVALAALLPLLAQIRLAHLRTGTDRVDDWWTHPAWASVLLVVAAALVGLDRFFGYSTAWIRYMDAQSRLRQALDDFELEWQVQRAAPGAGPLTPERTAALLAACRAFAAQVNTVLREETAVWTQEFQASLRQVDESVQARGAELRAPALTVAVANGELAQAGWTLSVGGVPRGGVRHGRSAAVAGLWPGAHTIRVAGSIGGREVQAEAGVVLAPGEARTVELTLE